MTTTTAELGAAHQAAYDEWLRVRDERDNAAQLLAVMAATLPESQLPPHMRQARAEYLAAQARLADAYKAMDAAYAAYRVAYDAAYPERVTP